MVVIINNANGLFTQALLQIVTGDEVQGDLFVMFNENAVYCMS
jgi:hypothetical protein